MNVTLELDKRDDGWWITGFPLGFEDHGPYGTKQEANEDRLGLQRTLKQWDERGFWKAERVRGKNGLAI
jgi:hypothetical protein